MFFILSKTFGLLTKPFSWIIILLLLTFFFRKTKWKKHFFIAVMSVLLLFSNPYFLDMFLRRWEYQPVPVNALPIYDIGIVLGGFSKYFKQEEMYELTAAGDRIWQTLNLYKKGKIKKIMITGGSYTEKKVPEAFVARDALIDMGVPADDIIMEYKSRNTHENAVFSVQIIDSIQHNARCLLITSAVHMRRSEACFRKAGLAPDIFPVDHITAYDGKYWAEWFVPKIEVLGFWDRLSNEWFGMIAYKVKGYI